MSSEADEDTGKSAGDAPMEMEGYDQFIETYEKDHIHPFEPVEAKLVRAFERCINCGLCLAACPVLTTTAADRYPGPRTIVNMLARSTPERWTGADIVYYCTSCGACETVCPRAIPIATLIRAVRGSVAQQDPSLVPHIFIRLAERVEQCGSVFGAGEGEGEGEG